MGSLDAEISHEHHHPEQSQRSKSRHDEKQKAQHGGSDGWSGPHNAMHAQHGDEQDDRSDRGDRADLHQRMAESNPGRAGPSPPARASVHLSPPIAQMTRRFPRVTTRNARPTMTPATQALACFRASRAPQKITARKNATGNMTSADCRWSDACFPFATTLFVSRACIRSTNERNAAIGHQSWIADRTLISSN